MIDYTMLTNEGIKSGTLETVQEARELLMVNSSSYDNGLLQFHVKPDILNEILDI